MRSQEGSRDRNPYGHEVPGVLVEVTTLLIPGLNDEPEEFDLWQLL